MAVSESRFQNCPSQIKLWLLNLLSCIAPQRCIWRKHCQSALRQVGFGSSRCSIPRTQHKRPQNNESSQSLPPFCKPPVVTKAHSESSLKKSRHLEPILDGGGGCPGLQMQTKPQNRPSPFPELTVDCLLSPALRRYSLYNSLRRSLAYLSSIRV